MPAIELQSVFKRFELQDRASWPGTLKAWLTDLVRGRRAPVSYHRVLEGVGFSVEEGDALGIIGRNGSGKSTLLRLIAGIYRPDSGTVHTEGRVASLLDLGAGFHYDFTGRENVAIEAMILGLTRGQIRQKFDEIVEFAELGEYIDQPLRTYSTGMTMRLAFSVAIQVDPDILLLDEILAVGDEAFAARCHRKIEELRARSLTMVMATHDMEAVGTWCDRVLWLDAGRVRRLGPPGEVIAAYHEHLAAVEAVPPLQPS